MPEPAIFHTGAHKAHISQRKLKFPLEHMGLNAGGLKVPSLMEYCWHHGTRNLSSQTYNRTQNKKITVNKVAGIILLVMY